MDMLRFRAETPKGPAILAKKGVKFAFQSGGAKSLNDFFINSGSSIQAGLSRSEAIRAMTLGAAEIFGVDDRLGSLEAGKIANITVVRGDNFSKDRVVTHVFVDGKLFEPKQKPAQKPGTTANGTATVSVGGNYSNVIQIPGQSMSGTLVLIQQGSSITGTIQSELGTAPIRNGKVTADGFTFDATVDVSGASTDISVRGSVTGNEVNGTIDSPQGAVPFSGTKNP
jgi:adenine deaminase